MDVRVGLRRKLNVEELMLLNYGVGEAFESPLDCKEIKPVHPKGDQSWVFIRRTDVEAETPILWPPDVKSWLIWKDPDAGKDWGQEEKGTIEDEMVGWHHLTQWTWVCVDSGSWWWTGRPRVLWFMGSQRVGHDSDWTELNHFNGGKWRGTKEPVDECLRGKGKSWLETQYSKNEDHGIWSHYFMASRRGKVETVTNFIFLGSEITVDGDWSPKIKRCLLLGRIAITILDSIEKQRCHFANQSPHSQSYGFSSCQVWM